MYEVQRVHVGAPPANEVLECVTLDGPPDDIRELLAQPGVEAVSINYISGESVYYHKSSGTCGQ